MMMWDLVNSHVGLTYWGQDETADDDDDVGLTALRLQADVLLFIRDKMKQLMTMMWSSVSSDYGLTYYYLLGTR